MSTEIPLLVGAGSVPERRMREAAEALAKLWALPLQTHATGASPASVLTDPTHGLIRLSGDPARQRMDGVSPCFFWFQGTLTAALVARPRPMQRYVISSVLRFRA